MGRCDADAQGRMKRKLYLHDVLLDRVQSAGKHLELDAVEVDTYSP